MSMEGFTTMCRHPPPFPPEMIPPAQIPPARSIFNRLGIRVPPSSSPPVTQAGTIIGANANDTSSMFDHSSIAANVEKRFALQALTLRDEAANALEIALNLANPERMRQPRYPIRRKTPFDNVYACH